MNKKFQYKYNNQLIYEWEQNLEEIHLYFYPPKWALKKYESEFKKQNPNYETSKMNIEILSDNLKISVGNNKPFLNNKFENNVDTDLSTWYIDEDTLHIILQKSLLAQVWNCVFKGHSQINIMEQEEIKKNIMKERFQKENPGFDFSDAEFNGNSPNPREFLGGLDYNKLNN